MVTKHEVLQAQEAWGQAIVAIGKAYFDDSGYKEAATETVDRLYGYGQGTVLFKPTKAAARQFRLTREEAISYFAGGSVSEDHGFALQPWSRVRFENAGLILGSDTALAMGNYSFTDAATGTETTVEFSFGYFRDEAGSLRIHLHHSSFPYPPHG